MMPSVAGVPLISSAYAYQKMISNNSYAYDEQGVNPVQVRGIGCVLYKLWPLLMPWLAACQPYWSENQSPWLDTEEVPVRAGAE